MSDRAAGGAAAPAGDGAGSGERRVRARPRLPGAVLEGAVGVGTVLAIGAVTMAWSGRVAATVGLAAFTAVLGLLSAIDLRQRRLPNRIVGPLSLAVVGVVAVAGLSGSEPWRVAGALGVGVGFSAGLLALSLAGSVGMGDVKLAFPIGAVAGWLGADAVWATLLVTSLTGAVAGALALALGKGRGYTLPYGPFLALGSLAGILAVGLG